MLSRRQINNVRHDIEESCRKELTDFTANGKCSRCTECCKDFLSLTIDEIKAIKNYITIKQIKPIRHVKFDDEGNPTQILIKCPFADKINKKCLIYPVRPLVCREFICSQTPEQIAEHQITHVIYKDTGGDIHFISMNHTFAKDELFLLYYQNDKLYERIMEFVEFE